MVCNCPNSGVTNARHTVHQSSSYIIDLYCLLQPVNPSWKLQEKMMHGTPTPPLYVPCFLLPLFSHLLDSAPVVKCWWWDQSWSLLWWCLLTGSIVDLCRFIDCGCLGYIVVALSSKLEEGVLDPIPSLISVHTWREPIPSLISVHTWREPSSGKNFR